VNTEFKNKKIAQLEEEKREIMERAQQEVEVLDAMIGSLKKTNRNAENHQNGSLRVNPGIPSLREASYEAMKALGRFTERATANHIREMYSDLNFSDKSLRKPMKRARQEQLIRQVQPSRGNKSQAIYEWIAN
jgi:hypothetical protein